MFQHFQWIAWGERIIEGMSISNLIPLKSFSPRFKDLSFILGDGFHCPSSVEIPGSDFVTLNVLDSSLYLKESGHSLVSVEGFVDLGGGDETNSKDQGIMLMVILCPVINIEGENA